MAFTSHGSQCKGYDIRAPQMKKDKQNRGWISFQGPLTSRNIRSWTWHSLDLRFHFKWDVRQRMQAYFQLPVIVFSSEKWRRWPLKCATARLYPYQTTTLPLLATEAASCMIISSGPFLLLLCLPLSFLYPPYLLSRLSFRWGVVSVECVFCHVWGGLAESHSFLCILLLQHPV